MIEINSTNSGFLIPGHVVNLIPQHAEDSVYTARCAYCDRELHTGAAALFEVSITDAKMVTAAAKMGVSRTESIKRGQGMINHCAADIYCNRECALQNGSATAHPEPRGEWHGAPPTYLSRG